MNTIPNIFFDEDIRNSSCYELAIQVSEDENTLLINKYAQFVWNLETVHGPLDPVGNKIEFDSNILYHDGIVRLGKHDVPFRLHVDKEEPGSHWFCVCFYTAVITKVFGSKYKTYTEFPHVPNAITGFFKQIMKELYSIHPFLLAMVGHEVSGQYYLKDLQGELSEIWKPDTFYIGRIYQSIISDENKQCITYIEDLI